MCISDIPTSFLAEVRITAGALNLTNRFIFPLYCAFLSNDCFGHTK